MNKKKLQILEAAKQLFSLKGFNDTSVADIIAMAKVSKGTFYNHFISKNDCMMTILQELHEQTIAERKIIAHFNHPTDIRTLEKELISHFNIILTSNIMDMMISSLNNQEEHKEIFEMIRTKAVSELHWLGKRLIDIYGVRATNKAYDCALMIIGSLHQLSLIRTIFIPSEENLEQDVRQVLLMIEPIIFSNRLNEKPLLSEEFLLKVSPIKNSSRGSSFEEVILDLEAFYEEYKEKFTAEQEAYTTILLNTLKNQKENRYLIKSLTFSFIKSFQQFDIYTSAFKIYHHIELLLLTLYE